MKIPIKFETILKENQTLHSIILDIVTSFEPIYKDNKLFFFEEYTDHGIQHVESVLASAEYIISDESFKDLTPKDVAILILSVILHDIGMHCEFSTFASLINGDYNKYRISIIDNKSWKELWDDYLSEVKRFSSQQKKNIFGNEYQQYNEPDLLNKDNLTGYDKKLIGEFIRRHHARLAHEIAFGGLFGSKNERILFGNEKLSPLYRQLCGIVARSHGMELRSTFSYLEEIASQGWRNPDDINVIFLMIVLRIADYIQIDNSRVSPLLLKLKSFNSPISLNEHKTHLAIESLSFNQPDSERIFASCKPNNSEMLIKLKTLFNDIQKEFDISWAVLGEVYGFLSPNFPRIKYRRIASNLDDNLYLNKLNFVPLRIKFEVNNDLSKLLVGPLYGNNPTYGVRELVQNAVDACLEREHIETQKQNKLYIPKITVSINTINESISHFIITDNGKGMSIDEILHYFLNVGSSFRKSLSWKKQFVDEDGNSLINRNGKFGIGVLAAFLIGEELTVITRHYNESIAYSFVTNIDSDFIDIKREVATNKEIGTTISLIISNEKKKELIQERKTKSKQDKIWTDWYINDYPKVEYLLDDKKIDKTIKINKKHINSFQTEDFKKIEWKYFGTPYYYSQELSDTLVVCNGIIITKGLEYEKERFISSKIEGQEFVIEQKPSFLFEDPEGIFPIKLDRNDIDCIELPFEKELFLEVAKDFIARILTIKLNVSSTISSEKIENTNSELLFSKEGYSLNFDFFTDKLRNNGFLLIRVISDRLSIPHTFLEYPNCFIYPVMGQKINLTYQENNVAPTSGGRILLKEGRYSDLFKSNIKRLSAWAKNNHTVVFKTEKVYVYDFMGMQNNNYISKSPFFESIESIKKIKIDFIESIQELNFSYFQIKGGEVLNTLLNQYFGGNAIIPYSLKERKKKYPNAFLELSKFIKHYT
ncbi:MAG TPA: ATP-binding protein [Chitinophagaceae bacterium]|nr:ATP-binding protein [Chitinophagaceae bacterium]